jgi:hypothetical protein
MILIMFAAHASDQYCNFTVIEQSEQDLDVIVYQFLVWFHCCFVR